MPGNEAQVVGAELERVLPNVPTLFDRDDTFYSVLEKRPVEVVSSRDMRIPLELRPGGKSGYYSPDGQDLGRGDMPYFDKAIVSSAHLKHAVEFTTKTMWSTDNNRKAVINAFRHNLAPVIARRVSQVYLQKPPLGRFPVGIQVHLVAGNTRAERSFNVVHHGRDCASGFEVLDVNLGLDGGRTVQHLNGQVMAVF